NPSQFIGEDDGVLYFYGEDATITGINTKTFTIASCINSGLPAYASNSEYLPKISDNIIRHRISFLANGKLYLWDLKEGRLVAQSVFLPQASIFFLRLQSENEVTYFSYAMNNALQLYRFKTKETTVLPVKGKDDKPIARCVIYPWGNTLLLSFNNRLYQ